MLSTLNGNSGLTINKQKNPAAKNRHYGNYGGLAVENIDFSQLFVDPDVNSQQTDH